MNMKRFLAASAFALLVSGCAFTEDTIPVKYTAATNTTVVEGARNVTVKITPTDGRTENRYRVSAKKNGFGTPLASIRAENDVVIEVGNAVKTELSSLGYKIGPGGIAITVEIKNFYNDFKVGLFSVDALAEVSFDLKAIRQDGALIYNRTYYATGTNNGLIIMSGGAAEPALSAALRDAVQSVVRDENLHQALVKMGTAPKTAGLPTS